MIALIFLHGSGGSGMDMRSFLDCIPLEAHGYNTFHEIATNLNIVYYTPTSSERPYNGSYGMPMNIWFDRSKNWMTLGTSDNYEDIIGIQNSMNQVLGY
jgi:hypothetical protein